MLNKAKNVGNPFKIKIKIRDTNKAKHHKTTPLNYSSNGRIERTIRTLRDSMIRITNGIFLIIKLIPTKTPPTHTDTNLYNIINRLDRRGEGEKRE